MAVTGSNMLHAELVRSDRAIACGIVARGPSPLLRLCRLLIDAGHDPDTPLAAWRDGTLCLRVRSIGLAARLRVGPHGVGFECLQECTAAPPVRGSVQP